MTAASDEVAVDAVALVLLRQNAPGNIFIAVPLEPPSERPIFGDIQIAPASVPNFPISDIKSEVADDVEALYQFPVIKPFRSPP